MGSAQPFLKRTWASKSKRSGYASAVLFSILEPICRSRSNGRAGPSRGLLPARQDVQAGIDAPWLYPIRDQSAGTEGIRLRPAARK
jgi:hypothetical protein